MGSPPRGPRAPGRPIPREFYLRHTLEVARDLLGCLLCRREADGSWTWGRIVETEAYRGEDDPACHAAAGRTPRTRVLYGPPGRAYVYFTYGMHHLLNAVTEEDGFPAAVLLRALEPLGGLERMTLRRGGRAPRELGSGPSRLCQALDVDLRLNEHPLDRGELQLRFAPGPPAGERILEGPRVGISRGVDRPWRFRVEGNPHVSRGRPGPAGARRGRRS